VHALAVFPERPQSIPRARARRQFVRKKNAPTDKKLQIEHLTTKLGIWVTSCSHVGDHWWEAKCYDRNKPEEYNGNLIDHFETMTDAERGKSMLPHATSFTTLLECVKHALLNKTFPYHVLGKGKQYGPPYPPGPEVDAVHLQLLGERQPTRFRTAHSCGPASRPPNHTRTCCLGARYGGVPRGALQVPWPLLRHPRGVRRGAERLAQVRQPAWRGLG